MLAARAAQRAQPGLVTLFTQENVYHAVASQLQSAMVNLWTPDMKLPDTVSAMLVGPGLAAPGLPDDMTHHPPALARLAVAGGRGRQRAGLAAAWGRRQKMPSALSRRIRARRRGC